MFQSDILKIYKQAKAEILYDIPDDDPYEILKLMCSEQVAQGNKKDENVFIGFSTAGFEDGGFSWGKSILGYNFWNDVIYNEKYYIGVLVYKCAKVIFLEKQGADSNTIRNFLSDFDKRRK